MQSQTLQAIRTRLDALRQAAESDAVIREQLIHDPVELLRATGLLHSDHTESATAEDSESHHRGGAIHLCPWHTCQATRHIVADPE